jgi:hypothetical protein
MKKTLLLVFVLSICTVSFAQKAQFGIKGGLNAARFKVENVDEDAIESRLGFHLGALAHIHVNRNFAIQPEVVYSQQGMIQEVGNREFEWKVNYVNIPVMFQYMFDGGFRIQAGPQLGVLASAEIEDQDSDADVDLEDEIKNVDVSLPIGIGYLSPSGFGFDARYNIGLSNVNENGVNDIRNRVFQVGIFYQFRR